jgi:hypothetical protein
MSQLNGLIAYPSSPASIGLGLQATLKILRSQGVAELSTWEENDIPGRFIVEPILSRIEEGNVLVADTTRVNFNVTFEIGYAIGRRKRVFLVRNSALTSSDKLMREVGIFDTLGYRAYSNSQELATYLAGLTDLAPLPIDESINNTAPVYLVLPKMKTDAEIRAISRIKKARLRFRAFDPEEEGRLSAVEAIENISQSHGVITFVLSDDRVDAKVQNTRAAFVAGLAFGLEKELLILQHGDDPVPLDYRDLVRSFRFPEQIDEAIADFSPAISARLQSAAPVVVSEPQTLLARLNLGASSAENELQELGNYFLETDEFRRTLRGEVKVVSGRKGSGKTALFAQLRDKLRQDRSKVILDLRPEGFQLLKFKERVLDYLEEGTKEHTITAFWEYLLLLEIAYKLLEKDRSLHMRDQRLYGPYRRLADIYYQEDFGGSEGDFAERMLKLTQRISDDFGASLGSDRNKRLLKTGEITELLYKHNVGALREDIIQYLEFKSALWILFDNLDKGWPPHGIAPEDVLTLRCLMDAMSKIQREVLRNDIQCHGVVFIRNDVYELLVANTPDRGKVPIAVLDWTDSDLLRELLRRRFIHGEVKRELAFEEIWPLLAVSHINGEESSQYLIDRSLMRPRALIDLLRYCRSHAVNLRHARIEISDIEQGEEAYSSDLLSNIDFEISDVAPGAGNILYEFVEAPSVLSGESVRNILVGAVGESNLEKVLDLLFWYGFLGFVRDNGETAYIYSVKYDIKRLRAIVEKKGLEQSALRINPAFWRALEVRH